MIEFIIFMAYLIGASISGCVFWHKDDGFVTCDGGIFLASMFLWPASMPLWLSWKLTKWIIDR